MKTRFITLLMLMCALGMQAQKLNWGAEGGYSLSHSTEGDGVRSGFNVGVKAEYVLSKGWYLDGALKLVSRPTNRIVNSYFYNGPGEEEGWSRSHIRTTPYYLELPIRIGHKFKVSDGCKLFVAAGPYVGVGLWGNGKWSFKQQEDPGEPVWGDQGKIDNVYDGYMQRLTVGGSARVGADLGRHLQLSLGYDLQFNSYLKSYNGVDRHQAFSVNVGWMF